MLTSAANKRHIVPQLVTHLEVGLLSFERYDSGAGWAGSKLEVQQHEKISLQYKLKPSGIAKPDVQLPFGVTMTAAELSKPSKCGAKKKDPHSSESESEAVADKDNEIPSEADADSLASESSGKRG